MSFYKNLISQGFHQQQLKCLKLILIKIIFNILSYRLFIKLMKDQHISVNQFEMFQGKSFENQSDNLGIQVELSQIENSNHHEYNVRTISKQEVFKNQHKDQYRPDIDGLRTIAVSIVIIFHAWPQFMTGGFIGVDVFFVISGYLISGIIIKEAQKKTFSYQDFYSRRIKRIYPALILVLGFVLFACCLKLYRDQLKMITKTMIASTIFGANIQIMTYNKGYFDLDVKRNPLLHLWSLGVEEQFYIIWPCLLSIVTNAIRKKGLNILVYYTLFSFFLGIVFVYWSPKIAFYLPFCRFWQMAVGGLVSYLNVKIQDKRINHWLSLIGIVSIMISVWIVNQKSLFPGWWALIPTLSAAAIILAGKQAYLNKTFLSSSIFVFIGKISYPMYLWHWPLLVFLRQFYQESQSIFANPSSMIMLTILLSIGTYYIVQRPLRYKKSKMVVILLFVSMMIIGGLAFTVNNNPMTYSQVQIRLQQLNKSFSSEVKPGPDDFYQKNGIKIPNSSKNKKRLIPTLQKITYSMRQFPQDSQLQLKEIQFSENLKNKKVKLSLSQVLNQGQQNKILIMGDSHAAFQLFRFKYLYEESVKNNRSEKFPTVFTLADYGVPFLPCSQSHNFFFDFIREQKPNKIFIMHRWTLYMRMGNINGPLHKTQECYHGFGNYNYNQSLLDLKEDMKDFQNSLKKLKDQGNDVYVANIHADSYDLVSNLMIGYNRVKQQRIKPYKLSKWREENKLILDLFQKAVQNAGVNLVDFADHSCWEDVCQVLTPQGFSVHADDNHYGEFYYKYWSSSVDFLVK